MGLRESISAYLPVLVCGAYWKAVWESLVSIRGIRAMKKLCGCFCEGFAAIMVIPSKLELLFLLHSAHCSVQGNTG